MSHGGRGYLGMGPEWDGPALQFGCPPCGAAKTGQGGPPAEKRAPG